MSPAAAPNIELATTAAARVASTTLLQADHHSYVLWFGGDAEGRQEPLLGSPNGLVYARQSDISVITGMSYGPIGLHVELHDAPPPLDLRDWEDNQVEALGRVMARAGEAPEVALEGVRTSQRFGDRTSAQRVTARR